MYYEEMERSRARRSHIEGYLLLDSENIKDKLESIQNSRILNPSL